ncbi:ATP-binding protein [Streptomyces sp. NPDC001507]|uniref:ATP-binding protein n=1 Tax=Streptomyces sp. NPDC001507 TaxID=3364579 RepID=UPI00369C9E66
MIVAEPAVNAITHGRVPGRDAELRLSLEAGQVRVEVSDIRGDRLPVARDAGGCEERGRGLVLLASPKEWGTTPHPCAPGKAVWAVVTSCAAASSSGPLDTDGSSPSLRKSSVDDQAQVEQRSHEGKVHHPETPPKVDRIELTMPFTSPS